MPRFDWDGPASSMFANADGISLRLATYRLVTKYGAPQVAVMFKRMGIDCNQSVIRGAVGPFIEKLPLHNCPRCGQETPSKVFCTSCSIAAERGDLTPRERERLRQHYAQAGTAYAETREREHAYREDEYTSGSKRHPSRHDPGQSEVLLDRYEDQAVLV